MDWTQFAETILTAALGAGIVKLMDLAVDHFRQGQRRKEEKANRLLAYLNEFAELCALYRLFRYSEGLKRDEKDEWVRDETGEFIVEERLEVEPPLEQAVKATLQVADLNSAIAQKIVNIRLRAGEMHDLACELNPSGSLREKFRELFLETATIGLSLRHKDFDQMVSALREADRTRREIRSMLQDR